MAKKPSKALTRGQIVCLRTSTTQLLVAEGPDKDGMVTVEWLDGKSPRTKRYHVDLLTPIPPSRGFTLDEFSESLKNYDPPKSE
jgi:uncharacterized protein YodC (DUF2158 family)